MGWGAGTHFSGGICPWLACVMPAEKLNFSELLHLSGIIKILSEFVWSSGVYSGIMLSALYGLAL